MADRPVFRGASVLTKTAAALVAVLWGAQAAQAAPVQIAITFDDLPAHSALPPGETRMRVAQTTIRALKAAGAPEVYGFVNGAGEAREPAAVGVLAAWRGAGFPLGNHTWSHMDLNSNILADWQADTVRNEPLLQAQMGQGDWRWLRYPYLSEGDTAEKRAGARAFLAARGYRVAQVTMSFADYAFNEPYARCMAKGDRATVARMEHDFLAAAADEVVHSRAMSQALFGRDIPYVLLMHIGAFDARMLPRLLDQYRAQGVTFVTLPQAEADPFYAPDLHLAAPAAADTLEAAMNARALPVPARKVDLAYLDLACR